MATPHAGYLLKRSKPNEWKTRYVVIDNGVLFYYKHKRDCNPKGVILLSGCSVSATPDQPGCSFAISNPSKPSIQIHWSTSDPSVTTEWMQAVATHLTLPADAETPPLPLKEHVVRPPDIPQTWTEPSPVPPQFSGTIDAMVTQMASFVLDHGRWALQTDHATAKSTQLYLCEKTRTAAMSKLSLARPAHEILDVLLDPLQDSSCLVEAIDGHTSLHRLTLKAVFPHHGRDFAVLRHWRTLSDRSILLLTRSQAMSSLYFEAYYIVPNLDSTAAEVTYVIHVDEVLPAAVVVSRAHKLDVLRAKFEPVSPRPLPRKSSCKVDAGVYEIPSQYAAEVDAAIDKLVHAATHADDEWIFHSEKSGVRAFSKDSSEMGGGGSFTTVLGIGHLDFPANMVLDFLLATQCKVEYDPMCAQSYQVDALDAHTTIDYYESKPVLIVAGRDFVNLVHWRVLPDNSIVVVAKATTDDRCPVKKWTVRGEIHVAGWRIVPKSTGGVDVAFMVQMDLKGSIPAFVQNRIVVDQAFVILTVASVLRKRPPLAAAPVTNKGKQSTASVKDVPAAVTPRKTTPSDVVKPKKDVAWTKSTTRVEAQVQASAPLSDLSFSSLVYFSSVFLAAVYIPPVMNLHLTFEILHDIVVWAVVAYVALQVYLGPAHVRPHWHHGQRVHGSLEVDCSNTLQYIASKGDKITMTHVVLRAVAQALKQSPTMNGYVIFGKSYPSATVDVSFLVENDPCRAVKFAASGTASLSKFADELTQQTGQTRLMAVYKSAAAVLPMFVVKCIFKVVFWLSQSLGFGISWLGVKPHMFGQAVIVNSTTQGFGALDTAPGLPAPLLIAIGGVTKKPTVVNDAIEARPVVRLDISIDPRLARASDVAIFSKSLRSYVETPRQLDAPKV
ncbi:unnamed protein product [Aphanomyces euteiches]